MNGFAILPGGLCDEHRAFKVTEELTGSLDRRQFHVSGPNQACPSKVKILGAIPQVGERPAGSPQHGLEVFRVEIETLTYRSWRVFVSASARRWRRGLSAGYR